MITLLSPSKTLNFEKDAAQSFTTSPVFLEQANYLAKKLSKLSKQKIKEIMKVSNQLAEQTVQQYKHWSNDEKNNNTKPAIYAFSGAVYNGFDVDQLSKTEISYAQKHIRILSGLYGLLKPLDAIQPYRLDVGLRWEITKKNKNLYTFWTQTINQQLEKELKQNHAELLINLASNEYFKMIRPKQVSCKVVTISFKENKNGSFRVNAFYAKQARGSFARFMVQERTKNLNNLKQFSEMDYKFNKSLSTDKEFVFTR